MALLQPLLAGFPPQEAVSISCPFMHAIQLFSEAKLSCFFGMHDTRRKTLLCFHCSLPRATGTLYVKKMQNLPPRTLYINSLLTICLIDWLSHAVADCLDCLSSLTPAISE